MDIYEPAEDSYLLQKQVAIHAFGRVLDIGTGSGIQALTAIKNPNVREVVAVDLNEKAVEKLKEKIKKKNLRKISAKKSDLFSNVESKFNTIIFNPPYLPQDEGIEDPALYGGRKGWEISEKFFSKVSKYLVKDGTILFLFSTLTNKDKIEEIIENNLLEFEELDSQKISFEKLFVYEIKKTPLLRELERRGLENIHYLARGKRGVVYLAELDKSKLIKSHFPKKKDIIKVAVKVKNKDSQALGRIENEARWLIKLQKENISPRLLFHADNFVAYQFVEGTPILGWIRDNQKPAIIKVLHTILEQCFTLDRLQVNKEELHHPLKHIIIDKNNHPLQIDFERSTQTDNPKNVTQFVEFICRMKKELAKKKIEINQEKLRELSKEYKETYSLGSFREIKNALQ